MRLLDLQGQQGGLESFGKPNSFSLGGAQEDRSSKVASGAAAGSDPGRHSLW